MGSFGSGLRVISKPIKRSNLWQRFLLTSSAQKKVSSPAKRLLWRFPVRKVNETIRGFKMIVDGECDELPEQAFYMVGTIDEAFEKAKTIK